MAQVRSLKTGIKFKDTPIGKVPVDWEVINLGKLSETITKGTTPTTYGHHYVEKGIAFLRVENISDNGHIILNDIKYISTATHEFLSRSKLENSDILFSIAGAIGRCALVSKNILPANINQAIAIIRIKDKELINLSFLTQMFLSKQIKKQTDLEATSLAQTNLNLEQVKSLKIPLPPLSEQKKIAEILSAVDDAIEETDKIIEKTKEVKKGLMQNLLTRGIGHKKFKKTEIGQIPEKWDTPQLEELCSLITNGYVGPTRDIYRSTGIPYLVSKNIRPNEISKQSFAFVDDTFQNTNKRSILKLDDVLTVQTGSIGDTCVVPKEFEGANCHALIISRPIPKLLNSYWLSEYFNSQIGRKEFSKIATGLAHPHLNTTFVRKLRIPLPPVREQKKIADILLSLNRDIDSETIHKQNLESLKKSLMQVLLTGKIRVKVA